MNILVLNCGSSSIKYQLMSTQLPRSQEKRGEALAGGLVDRIGQEGAVLTHRRAGGTEIKIAGEILDHIAAIRYVLSILISKNHGVMQSIAEIDAIGHRVVHGGEHFAQSVLIDDEVIGKIRECIDLAPLHNPNNLRGITACREILPAVPQVAVFDTAFHQTMPEHAYLYGLPYLLYKRHGIRRYGFHGTSHLFVSQRAAALCGRPLEKMKMITCHLGNGCSITAIDGGKSIDTSMGFTPLEGLLMGTRSGDLDPSIILYLMGKEELTLAEGTALLNKHSGLLGISGVSGDMREIVSAAAENSRAATALNIFAYRLRKYIGGYIAVLGRLDALVFTGGIGENAAVVREKTVNAMEYLGLQLDAAKNHGCHGETEISPPESPTKIFVIPTNEELIIALDTQRIVESLGVRGGSES